jgi:hypothetical protein
MKVKTGEQKQYIFERMPPSVWGRLCECALAGRFYNGGLEIDYQLEPGGLLHRSFGRCGAGSSIARLGK